MRHIYIISAIIIAIAINNSQAQVVNICAGSDSITLRAGNFQYGTIEWESSKDMVHWEQIQGEHDTLYTFMPTVLKYYRAVNKFSHCPPGYSEVSLVKVAPNANAGSDRIVPDTLFAMLAGLNPDENGLWSVLSGSDGVFTNANDPHTMFQAADSLYTLIWTVTNACGTDNDTINIQIRNNSYISQLVIVDITDNLLSDSLQIVNGEYVVEFNTPQPVITDSTILVGIAADGFLRKVISFTQIDSTYTMQTEQASLEDITINGAFNVAQVFDIDSTMGGLKFSNSKQLHHMPTRAELTTDPKYKTGNYYYFVTNEPFYTYPGVNLKNPLRESGGSLIDLNFNQTILSYGGVDIKLNGNYRFAPNIKADLDYSLLNINSFKFGMYNGTIERNYELILTAGGSASIVDQEFTLLSMNKDIIFVVGGVPVWIRTEFNIDGHVSVDVAASISLSHQYTKKSTYTAALEYENDQWNYIYNQDDSYSTDNSFEVRGDLTQNFDIGPNITFKLYGIVGPYIDLSLTEEFNICSYNANWQANMEIGGSLTLGAKAEVLGTTLFDVSKAWSQGYYNLQLPHRIEMVSGNQQDYIAGSELEHPVVVRVKSNKGFYVPGAVVSFLPQNGGSVSNNTVITDVNGYAQALWTPGGSGSSSLQVSVFDCDGNHISNSPIIFTAYESSLNCPFSTLNVSIIESGGIIYPIAHMGVAPYTYSTNGISYSSTVPSVVSVPNVTYTFYVKDSQNCFAMISNTSGDACANTDLSLNLSLNGSTIEAIATGGTSPYKYSIDGGSFSSTNTFTNVSNGYHTVYVKDVNLCTDHRTVYVYTGGIGYGNVLNPITGKIWMDRNLGASQVATSSADPDSYGDLYQWGRDADGHQLRTSGTTSTLSSIDTPGHGNFITNSGSYDSPYDWRKPQNNNLWQGASGINNPCPSRYRLPTQAEWVAEYQSWSIKGSAGAFASLLKLPAAGARNRITGSLGGVGSIGSYWSSTVDGYFSFLLSSSDPVMNISYRASGLSVRCIMDTDSNIPILRTNPVTSITTTSAVSGGNVTSDCGKPISARGVVWSTTQNPTIESNQGYSTDGSGVGEFASSLTGLNANTTYYVRAYATNGEGTGYGQQESFKITVSGGGDDDTEVVDITNPTTGKIWMDRNLGSSRVATSSTDAEAYGNLYQWGRGNDGHEKRNSPITSTLSNSDIPGHGNFIKASSPYDWRSPQNDNLWQGVSGTNNPCPSGYRLPTEAELNDELSSWVSADPFTSPLKFSVAGNRYQSTGSPSNVGSYGYYWSSTVDGTLSRSLFFGSGYAYMHSNYRALGASVRCLKD